MATIVIKDLPDNIELDREAMLNIVGGARSRGQNPVFRRAHIHNSLVGQSQAPANTGYLSQNERKRFYSSHKSNLLRQT